MIHDRNARQRAGRRRGPACPTLCAAFAALAVMGAVACSRPQPPTLTPEVARVAQVSASGIDLDVEVRVDNPNTFALHTRSVSGTLYVADGQKLGAGAAQPEQSIPAGGSALVPSRIHIAWQDVSALAPLLLKAAVPYTFQGDVTLGSEDFNVTLPFSLDGQLSRSQLLSAGLRGI